MSANTINDGGPAFPRLHSLNNCKPGEKVAKYSADGMSMRDYFAAKAMQGFIAGHIAHYGHENHWPWSGWSGIADSAYEVADAMLEQRAKAVAA